MTSGDFMLTTAELRLKLRKRRRIIVLVLLLVAVRCARRGGCGVHLRPAEPQALRAVARFLSLMHQPEALKFWKQLAGKTALTREDVRDQATIAIIACDASRADVSVRELIGSHAEPADWLLSAQLSIQKNLRDEAKSGGVQLYWRTG